MQRTNVGNMFFSQHRVTSPSAATIGPASVWRRISDGLRFAADVVIEARAMQARERLKGKGRRFAEW
jgi:hypothetical protein